MRSTHSVLPLFNRGLKVDKVLGIVNERHCEEVGLDKLGRSIVVGLCLEPVVRADELGQKFVCETVLAVHFHSQTLLEGLFGAIELNSAATLRNLEYGHGWPHAEREFDRLELLGEEVPLKTSFLLAVVGAKRGRIEQTHTFDALWVRFYLVADSELIWVLKVVELLGEGVLAAFSNVKGD